MNLNKVIKISGKEYDIPFPNVGQLMDIESFKMSYTNGKYTQMAFSPISNHIFALDVADSLAYFSILIPSIKEDLGIKNWREVDAQTAKKIVRVYKNDFIPWFKPLMDDLYEYDKDESKEESNKSDS